MELSLNQIDVQKLNLQPGEVLIVTIKNNEVTQENILPLRENLSRLFPNNKVIFLLLSEDSDVNLTTISTTDTKSVSSCDTGNFCNDCSCGKKEDFLASQESQNE